MKTINFNKSLTVLYFIISVLLLIGKVHGDQTLYRGRESEITAPDRQLGKGSLEVHSLNHLSFADWTSSTHRESFALLQKIANVWQSQGIQNYLILGRISLNEAKEFYWEIVPYPDDELAFLQKIKTTYHIFFGGAKGSLSGYPDFTDVISEHEPSTLQDGVSIDYFCREDVIKRQQINSNLLSSKHTHLLYNYKPLLPDHLMIISRDHRQDFSDLQEKEYLESMSNLMLLCNKFSENNSYNNVWVYHKKGERAGQTVPHWHMHVVVESHGMSNWEKGRRVLTRICFPFLPPISQDKLDKKIAHYQDLLSQ